MGIGRYSAEQRLPCGADVVFPQLVEILTQQDFKIKSHDRLTRQITAVTKFHWWKTSWGENIAISIMEDGPEACRVVIESRTKGGGFGLGHNRKNVTNILMELEGFLSLARRAPSASSLSRRT